MSFFKKIFGADDDGTPKKRIWPTWHVDQNDKLSPEELLRQKFIYTRVFKIENKDDYKRYGRAEYIYAAVVPSGYQHDNSWRMYYFSYSDGDKDPQEHSRQHVDASESLESMVEFEKNMIARGNQPLAGSTSNLNQFAASLGQYINDKNRIFSIDRNDILQTATELPRSAVDAFYVAAATQAPTSTWEWFNERYIDSMAKRFEKAVDILRQENTYPYVMDRSSNVIKSCKQLPKSMQTDNYASRRDALRYAAQTGGNTTVEYINDRNARALFHYAYNMTRLVGILRAGAEIIARNDDFNSDGSVNQHKIALLKSARNAAHSLMESQLGMQAEERKAIVDVMLRGKDVRDGITPLEVLYTAFPPLPKPSAGPGPGIII